MTSIASSNISRRTSAAGQGSPRMCSFRFSPVPIPRVKRPGIRHAAVAAAWAMIAGWMRMRGQVTPVARRRLSVASAMPPITLQTKGLEPCASTQGWKWSETKAYSKPASSASRASSMSSRGPQSSLASATPISGIASRLPLFPAAKRSGNDSAALADRVLGPVLDERHQPLFAAGRARRELDIDLMHGRLDVGGDLEPLLGDDLHGVELVEQRLREAVDLGLGRLAAGKDAEVDDESRAGEAFACEDERGIGHAPLIPSRGSHLNIRTASKRPARPQPATTTTAPAWDESASSSRK